MFDSIFSIVAWKIVIWNAALAAVLAILVFSLSRFHFLRRRPGLIHSLWLLVLIKLLTPPLIPVPILASRSSQTDVFRSPEARRQPGHSVRDSFQQFAPANRIDPSIEHQGQTVPVLENHSMTSNALEPSVATTENNSIDNQRPLESFMGNHPVVSKTSEQKAKSIGSTTSTTPESNSPSHIKSVSTITATTPVFLIAVVAIWIAGTIILLVRSISRITSFVRLLNRYQNNGQDNTDVQFQRLQKIMDSVCKELQCRSVKIRMDSGSFTPFIWIGNRRRLIVIPRNLVEQLSDLQLKSVICHELAHYLRRDHWYNWVGMIVTVVFWWNPVAWFAFREMRKAQELCADEFAIEQSGVTRKNYLTTLFQSIELMQTSTQQVPSFANSFGSGKSICSRFQTLAKGKQSYRNGWKSHSALLFFVLLFHCLPVQAFNQENQEQEKPNSTNATQSNNNDNNDKDNDNDNNDNDNWTLKQYARLEGIMTKGSHRASFSPDGKYLAVGAGERANSLIYRVRDGSVVSSFNTEGFSVHDMEFTPDGTKIVSSSHNGVELADVKTGQRIRSFYGHTSKLIREVDISSDGKWVVTGSANRAAANVDATIRVWELETGKQLHSIPLLSTDAIKQKRTCIINSMEVAPNKSAVLASVCYYGKDGNESCGLVAEFDIKTGQIKQIFSVFFPERLKNFLDLEEIPGHPETLSKSRIAIYSPDGEYVATGHAAVAREGRKWADSDNCAIRIWEVKSGINIGILKGHRSNVYSLDFTADSKKLVSCSCNQFLRGKSLPSVDHSIRVWDVKKRKELVAVNLVKPGITVRMSPTENVIASVGAFRGQPSLIELWKLETETRPSPTTDPYAPIQWPKPRPNASAIHKLTSQIDTASAGSNKESLFVKRATEFIHAFEWNKAATDFSDAIESGPNNALRHMRLGIIRKIGKQDMAYDVHVQKMLSKFKNSNNGVVLEKTAMMCVLSKSPIGERNDINSIIAKAVAKTRASGNPQFSLNTKALVHYRFGEYENALVAIAEGKEESLKGRHLPGVIAIGQLIKAMTLIEMGQVDSGIEYYEKADQTLRKKLANPDMFREEANWQNWLVGATLHDECRLLLKKALD